MANCCQLNDMKIVFRLHVSEPGLRPEYQQSLGHTNAHRPIPAHDSADVVLASGDSGEAIGSAYPQLTTTQIDLGPLFANACPRRCRSRREPFRRSHHPSGQTSDIPAKPLATRNGSKDPQETFSHYPHQPR